VPKLKRVDGGMVPFQLEPFLLFLVLVMSPLRELNRYLPEQDTVTEVLIVLVIVMSIYFFSWADNLQSVMQQILPSVSEASHTAIKN
jgi:hypothetical protein